MSAFTPPATSSRDYNDSRNIVFSVDKLKAAAPSIFGESYGETILKECNKGLQADGATKPHNKLIAPMRPSRSTHEVSSHPTAGGGSRG